MKKIVIAIDGPSASGKGTLAKKLASHFNLAYLNTGAIYRMIAYRMIKKNIIIDDLEFHLNQLTKNISEQDLENSELFSEEVGALASMIAKNQKLRDSLFLFQKNFVEQGKIEKNGAVLDGRDTTSIICPDANYKFFITADVKIRAKRRHNQDPNSSYSKILEQLKIRDHNDFNRVYAPLKIVDDAIVIDNGNLTIEQSFELLLENINK